ncbi:MAG: hypothetical protein MI807_02245 [Verrucomicrobiales bacterium]|nr:hypothetical protein [Verrucomicrobiales bacterium]
MLRIVLFFTLLCSSASLSADEPPKVEAQNIRRIPHNGEHNAFTDLIRWKGAYWLTFRSCADGHMVFPTSTIRILRSDDAKEWEEVHQFSVAKRDVRDPHFLIFRGKLFVYTGTWWSGDGELPREEYDINLHLGYAAYSSDGNTWSAPTQLEGTFGHYIWRAAAYGDKAYLCGRRKRDYSNDVGGSGGVQILEAAMLESEDGINWRYHSLFQPEFGNETAFLFEKDGTLLSLSRCKGNLAQLSRTAPPWKEKELIDIPLYVGGPLLVKWGDRYLVGGRRTTPEGPRTTLYWLENNELKPALELPSDGDNSYPGFVENDDGSGLLSWYSTHEKDEEGIPITAVYLADLILTE